MKTGLFLASVMVVFCMMLAIPAMAQDDAAGEMMSSEVTLIVTHKVADFAVWAKGFDEHGALRESGGSTGSTVYQAADDPNMVTVVESFGSLEKANAFIESEDLKKAMEELGVEGLPEIKVVTKHKEYAH